MKNHVVIQVIPLNLTVSLASILSWWNFGCIGAQVVKVLVDVYKRQVPDITGLDVTGCTVFDFQQILGEKDIQYNILYSDSRYKVLSNGSVDFFT